MARKPAFVFSRRIGRFRWDRAAIWLLGMTALIVAGHGWLLLHPEHDPRAPLDLNDPVGWATRMKLDRLRSDANTCRAVLERSGISFEQLPPTGEGNCRREDRARLASYPFAPDSPEITCPTAVALVLWQRESLQPAAREHFGQTISEIRHLGSYSCRRLYGRSSGRWSEHATGNAIDVAGFELADGTAVSVLDHWGGPGPKAAFLRDVRDGACEAFATTLSPDYNAAHADHFHLDQQRRGWGGVCR